MWAKVLSNVIISVLSSLASWAFKKISSMIRRKKRIEETQDAAKEVQDAKTQDDVRASVDNLP